MVSATHSQCGSRQTCSSARLSVSQGRSGPPVARSSSTAKHQAWRHGKSQEDLAKVGERPASLEVEMGRTAPPPPAVRKGLEKNSHHTSFALGKATHSGLIHLLSFPWPLQFIPTVLSFFMLPVELTISIRAEQKKALGQCYWWDWNCPRKSLKLEKWPQ